MKQGKTIVSAIPPARLVKLLGAALASAAAATLMGGCQTEHKAVPETMASASPGQPPTTLPDKYQPATTAPSVAAAASVMPKGPAATDMTHVIAKDEPYYASMPSAGDKPAGTLKAGTKALLVVPGAMYSKVTTDAGTTVYTMTDGLEPIAKR